MNGIFRLGLIGLVCGAIANVQIGFAQEVPKIKKIAHVEGNAFTTFRAAELKTPWLYVLERDGDLRVFKIPKYGMKELAVGFFQVFANRFPADLNLSSGTKDVAIPFVKPFFKKAGDGNDMEIFGDVLALTSKGKLAVFSITDPSKPKKIGDFGSSGDSQSIVRSGNQTFVLGSGKVISWDFSVPSRPKQLGTLTNGVNNFNGCCDGKFLYVSQFSSDKNQTGIAVYDVSDPKSLRQRHFVATPQLAYHLFFNADGQLLACLDSKTLWHTVTSQNITVSGTTSIYELKKNGSPKLVSTIKSSGGRTAVSTRYKDGIILLCNGLVFLSNSSDLKQIFSFYPDGHTLDGAPYHGDQYGQQVALASDNLICVFRVGDPLLRKIGKWFAVGLLFFFNSK